MAVQDQNDCCGGTDAPHSDLSPPEKRQILQALKDRSEYPEGKQRGKSQEDHSQRQFRGHPHGAPQ